MKDGREPTLGCLPFELFDDSVANALVNQDNKYLVEDEEDPSGHGH